MNGQSNRAVQHLEYGIDLSINAANGLALTLLCLMPLPVFFDVVFRLLMSKSIPGAIEIEESSWGSWSSSALPIPTAMGGISTLTC